MKEQGATASQDLSQRKHVKTTIFFLVLLWNGLQIKQKLEMSYFDFGKTSDTGLEVIFQNKPEKSGLDETTTE